MGQQTGCVRPYFNACWLETGKRMLFYCNNMRLSVITDQRKIIFNKKLFSHNNTVVYTVHEPNSNPNPGRSRVQILGERGLRPPTIIATRKLECFCYLTVKMA